MNINNTLWLSGTAAQLEGLILTLASPKRWEEHMPIRLHAESRLNGGVWLGWGLAPMQTLGTGQLRKDQTLCPRPWHREHC